MRHSAISEEKRVHFSCPHDTTTGKCSVFHKSMTAIANPEPSPQLEPCDSRLYLGGQSEPVPSDRPSTMPDILSTVSHRPWPLPTARWSMTQRWNDLLFAHWPVPRP